MIDNDRIEEMIFHYISNELVDIEEGFDLGPEENLLSSGLVDSMSIARLIGHLQDQVGVRVPPDGLVPENFRSVRTMAAYLGSLQSA